MPPEMLQRKPRTFTRSPEVQGMDIEHLGTRRLPGRWPSYAICCFRCLWLSRACLPGDVKAWLKAQDEARAHECDADNKGEA